MRKSQILYLGNKALQVHSTTQIHSTTQWTAKAQGKVSNIKTKQYPGNQTEIK